LRSSGQLQYRSVTADQHLRTSHSQIDEFLVIGIGATKADGFSCNHRWQHSFGKPVPTLPKPIMIGRPSVDHSPPEYMGQFTSHGFSHQPSETASLYGSREGNAMWIAKNQPVQYHVGVQNDCGFVMHFEPWLAGEGSHEYNRGLFSRFAALFVGRSTVQVLHDTMRPAHGLGLVSKRSARLLLKKTQGAAFCLTWARVVPV
jgi:hypothetical protein